MLKVVFRQTKFLEDFVAIIYMDFESFNQLITI